MSAGESEASSRGSQIGKEEQQEQTTRSGLVEEEEEEEDQVVHAVSPLADRAVQAATMTMMTTAMTGVDQARLSVDSSAHKAPIQKEPTRHRKKHEMRSPTLQGDSGDSTETLVRVQLHQLLRSGEEFLNL